LALGGGKRLAVYAPTPSASGKMPPPVIPFERWLGGPQSKSGCFVFRYIFLYEATEVVY